MINFLISHYYLLIHFSLAKTNQETINQFFNQQDGNLNRQKLLTQRQTWINHLWTTKYLGFATGIVSSSLAYNSDLPTPLTGTFGITGTLLGIISDYGLKRCERQKNYLESISEMPKGDEIEKIINCWKFIVALHKKFSLHDFKEPSIMRIFEPLIDKFEEEKINLERYDKKHYFTIKINQLDLEIDEQNDNQLFILKLRDHWKSFNNILEILFQETKDEWKILDEQEKQPNTDQEVGYLLI